MVKVVEHKNKEAAGKARTIGLPLDDLLECTVPLYQCESRTGK